MEEESYPDVCIRKPRIQVKDLYPFEIFDTIRVLKVFPGNSNINTEDCSFLVGPNSSEILGSLDSQGVPRTLTKEQEVFVKGIIKVSENKKIIERIISGPRFNTSDRDLGDSRIPVSRFGNSWKTRKGNFVLEVFGHSQVVVTGVQEKLDIRPLTWEETSEIKSMGFSSFLVDTPIPTKFPHLKKLQLSWLTRGEIREFQNLRDLSSKEVWYREANTNFVLSLKDNSLKALGYYIPDEYPEYLNEKQRSYAIQLGLLDDPFILVRPTEDPGIFREHSHNFILTLGEEFSVIKVLGVQAPGEERRALTKEEKSLALDMGLIVS